MSLPKKLSHAEGPACPLCEEKLKTAHPTIREWFLGKKAKYRNLHVSCAYRGAEEQEKAFKEHATTLHYPESKHNHTEGGKPCSLAVDVFQIDEDGRARFSSLFCAKLNAENQAEGLKIRWGGTFHLKHGNDGCHFEVI